MSDAKGRLLALAVLASLVACSGNDSLTGSEPIATPFAPDELSRRAQTETQDPTYLTFRKLALDSFRASRSEDAVKAASAAIRFAPHLQESYQLLSQICAQTGQDEVAIKRFAEATDAHPRVPYPWFYRAVHEYNTNRSKDAAHSYERTTRLAPGAPEFHYRLAQVRHQLGEFEAALAASQKAYRLDPTTARYATTLVRELRIMGNDNEANRIVNEALKRIPNSGELHYARSQLMSREARLEEVERELLKAIELNPTLGAAYHDLSALLMRAGRPDEALFAKASFNRLTEYDRARAFLIQRRPLIPDHPGIPMMLGELELSANMFNEAERWFSRSESLSGDVSRIAAGRATVAFLNGQDDRGRRQLAAMGEWADPRGYLAQAARHLSEGSLETSAALVDRAVNAAPEEKEFFHLAALLSEQLHRPGRAIELLDHATNVPHARAPGLATVADSGDKQQKSRSTP